jgi:TonB family protein
MLVAVLLAGAQFGMIAPPTRRLIVTLTQSQSAESQNAAYLLPLWPTQAARPRAEHVQWTALSHQPTGRAAITPAPVDAERSKGHPRAPQTIEADVPVALPDSYEGSKVYIEPEVERPVVRDPASDGPQYPEYLRTRGIEGSVVIRFIVDTTGHADSVSLRVVETSHVGFADAVRIALPHMKFVPAQQAGRHVPQLVMQEFRFVIRHPDSAATTRRGRGHR